MAQDKWMQKLNVDKGALHRALKIPEGQKIPTPVLREAAAHGSPKVKKEANLALRYRGL